jgi:hypothetical protein
MASRRRENPYLQPKNQERPESKEGFRFIKSKGSSENLELYKQMLESSGLKIHPKQMELLKN